MNVPNGFYCIADFLPNIQRGVLYSSCVHCLVSSLQSQAFSLNLNFEKFIENLEKKFVSDSPNKVPDGDRRSDVPEIFTFFSIKETDGACRWNRHSVLLWG